MLAVGVTAAMVATEFMEVSVSTISKAAMNKGMSQFVFTVYSNALAIFILLPSTLIYYRKRTRPTITVCVICRIWVLALLSCCVQMFLNVGIAYSSPTLAAAMVDLAPAFTFLLAIFSRMERLDFSSSSSYAKSMGTILSIAGALIITLCKGPPITSASSMNISPNQLLMSLPANWVNGGIFCAAGAFSLAILYIVQTWVIRHYPAELMVTLIACIFVTLLSAVVSVIVERDPNSWRLKPDMELMAIGFS
uniref:WAT1-related protein n=2 Tax=Rhizophora mucronata TaxID=61149 RepID=A0A2P2M293_RHIMU